MSLHVTDPARTAAREHGELLRFPVLKLLQELRSLLHDGEVCREIRVEDIVEAHDPEGRRQALHRRLLRREAEFLAPGGTDGRCDLRDHDLLRILQGLQHPIRVVPLPERTHRTMGDALSAESTPGVLQTIHIPHIHRGLRAGVHHVPDMGVLDLVADLDTAHALDALVIFPDQGKCLRALLPGQHLLKGHAEDVEVIGHPLERTVAGAGADGTVGVVLRQDQLHIGLPGISGLPGIGADHHALRHRVVAGREEPVIALHLHHADTAGTDFIDLLQKAKCGDADSRLCSRIQYGGSLRYGNRLSVNCTIYHFASLPPLKIP